MSQEFGMTGSMYETDLATPARSRPIEDLTRSLSDGLSRLEKQVVSLGEVMSPSMRMGPNAVVPEAENPKFPGGGSSLASLLQESCARVDSIERQLRTYQRDCEL